MGEIWQFAGFLGAVAVVFVLWLNIIYLPGRTLEHRYDAGEDARRVQGEEAPGPEGSETPSQSESDPTR